MEAWGSMMFMLLGCGSLVMGVLGLLLSSSAVMPSMLIILVGVYLFWLSYKFDKADRANK